MLRLDLRFLQIYGKMINTLFHVFSDANNILHMYLFAISVFKWRHGIIYSYT